MLQHLCDTHLGGMGDVPGNGLVPGAGDVPAWPGAGLLGVITLTGTVTETGQHACDMLALRSVYSIMPS